MNEYIVLFDIYVALILMGQYIAKDHLKRPSVDVQNSYLVSRGSIANSKISEENNCKLSNKKIHLRLKQNLWSIQKSCGGLCDTSLDLIKSYNSSSPSHAKKRYKKHFDHLLKNINCSALWDNSLIDESSHHYVSPMQIPKYLYDNFTYHGQIKIRRCYIEEDFSYNITSAVRI